MADTENQTSGWSPVLHAFIDSPKKNIGAMAAWLYVVLSRHANAEGQCWPSHGLLVQKSGLSRSSVIRELEALEKAGMIKIEPRPKGASNLYTILPYTFESYVPYVTQTQGSTTQTQEIYHTDTGGVSVWNTPYVTEEQGVFHTDTPPVPHRHTEEEPRTIPNEKEPMKKKESAPNGAARPNSEMVRGSPRFQKPCFAEVLKFFADEKQGHHAKKFYDYYESNGWKVGRNPMKNWEASARNWIARELEKTSTVRSSGGSLQDMAAENGRRLNALIASGQMPAMSEGWDDE